MPALRRRALNARVVAALRAAARSGRGSCTTRSRRPTRRRSPPPARRPPARRRGAGSHRQALAHFESVLAAPGPARAGRARRRARRLRLGALQRAPLPRGRRGRAGAPRRCTTSWATRSPWASASCASRATCSWPGRPTPPRTARGGRWRCSSRRARRPRSPTRRSTSGAILAMTDAPEEAAETLAHAALARPARRARGPRRAGAQLPRHRLLRGRRHGRGAGAAARQHRRVARRCAATSTSPAATATWPSCWAAAGRLDELDAAVADGLRFARERGFWSHAYNLEVQRCTALAAPRPVGARRERACARSSTASRTPGMLITYSVPWLGRVLARRGDPDAARAAGGARGSRRAASGCCSASPTPGSRCAEWAWLAGERAVAAEVAAELLPRTAARGRRAVPRASCCATCARAGTPRRAVPRLPGAVGRRPAGRLGGRGGGLGGGGRPVRAGARAGGLRRRGGDARGTADPRARWAPARPRRGPARSWPRSAPACRARAGPPATTRRG